MNMGDIAKSKVKKKNKKSINYPASIVRRKVLETGVTWPLKSILRCRRNCIWDILSKKGSVSVVAVVTIPRD